MQNIAGFPEALRLMSGSPFWAHCEPHGWFFNGLSGVALVQNAVIR